MKVCGTCEHYQAQVVGEVTAKLGNCYRLPPTVQFIPVAVNVPMTRQSRLAVPQSGEPQMAMHPASARPLVFEADKGCTMYHPKREPANDL